MSLIKGEAAIVPAAPSLRRAPDHELVFRQDANFFYLTGLTEPDCVLVLLGSPKGLRSVLYIRERNPSEERWQGERLGVARAKRRFRVDEVRNITELESTLPKLLSDSAVLHYPAGINPQIDELIWRLYRSLSGPRVVFPHTIRDLRLLTSEMRVVKDRHEIQTIRHVVDITAHAILFIMRRLGEVTSELHGARMIEQHFSKLGASGASFPSIVAAGRNATCLHHQPRLQPLWRRELVLIDVGAEFRGYAGDITRTLPASGKFTSAQADLYDAVLSALKAGISRARPESTLEIIHQAIVRELVSGLLSLRILKGNASDIIASESYKKYYPHRSGHFLGLDVHDITPIQAAKSGTLVSGYQRLLVPGNVFTIEPGLYCDPKDDKISKHFRGVGIRLEEDVLITSNGCEVLSARMPVERSEIEAIMGEA